MDQSIIQISCWIQLGNNIREVCWWRWQRQQFSYLIFSKWQLKWLFKQHLTWFLQDLHKRYRLIGLLLKDLPFWIFRLGGWWLSEWHQGGCVLSFIPIFCSFFLVWHAPSSWAIRNSWRLHLLRYTGYRVRIVLLSFSRFPLLTWSLVHWQLQQWV